MTDVTLSVPREFAAYVEAQGLTVAQVLQAFMADLAETADSNGSDERMRAADWFDRVLWPQPLDDDPFTNPDHPHFGE